MQKVNWYYLSSMYKEENTGKEIKSEDIMMGGTTIIKPTYALPNCCVHDFNTPLISHANDNQHGPYTGKL